MTAPDPRVGEIEVRHRDCLTYNFGMHAADKLAHEDVSYLLAELRKAHEALARVETLAERTESHGNLYVFVDDLTSAVAAANGDGNG